MTGVKNVFGIHCVFHRKLLLDSALKWFLGCFLIVICFYLEFLVLLNGQYSSFWRRCRQGPKIGFMLSLQRRDGFIRPRPRPITAQQLHSTALQIHLYILHKYICTCYTNTFWNFQVPSLQLWIHCNVSLESSAACYNYIILHSNLTSFSLHCNVCIGLCTTLETWIFLYLFCFAVSFKRALRWWPSSRQMDHEGGSKKLMSCPGACGRPQASTHEG